MLYYSVNIDILNYILKIGSLQILFGHLVSYFYQLTWTILRIYGHLIRTIWSHHGGTLLGFLFFHIFRLFSCCLYGFLLCCGQGIYLIIDKLYDIILIILKCISLWANINPGRNLWGGICILFLAFLLRGVMSWKLSVKKVNVAKELYLWAVCKVWYRSRYNTRSK